MTHVRDSQSGEVVSLELATHALAAALGALAHVRWHVAARARTQTALLGSLTVGAVSHGVSGRGGAIVGGRHGVLERTPRGEMLALANTALDLLIAQLLLQTLLLGLAAALFGLLRLHALPVARGPENDVLAYGGCVGLRALALAFFEAEFRPCAALSDGGVYSFAVYNGLGLGCHAHFLAGVVPFMCDCGFGAVGAGRCDGGGQCVLVGLAEVVGPVGP